VKRKKELRGISGQPNKKAGEEPTQLNCNESA
jgi:hypothetical protein